MAIIAKNIIVGGENKTPPIKEEVKPVLKRESIPFKDIRKEVEIAEEKPKYHEIHDGDLHKLINRKSSYLVDMIDLDN